MITSLGPYELEQTLAFESICPSEPEKQTRLLISIASMIANWIGVKKYDVDRILFPSRRKRRLTDDEIEQLNQEALDRFISLGAKIVRRAETEADAPK